MNQKRLRLAMMGCVCTLAYLGHRIDQALPAQKLIREQAQDVTSLRSPKLVPRQTQKPSSPHAEQSGALAGSERQPEVMQSPGKRMPSELKPTTTKGRPPVKVRKKTLPKAVLQLRTDFRYHGMFEDARRYDPSPARRKGGVPNPQAGELHHDHFQELDRNRDGLIDPFERVLGRLDIDRDLPTRQ